MTSIKILVLLGLLGGLAGGRVTSAPSHGCAPGRYGTVTLSDKGLLRLATLKNLPGINAKGTRVTDKGVAELPKALCRCGVRGHEEDEDDRRASSPTPSQGDPVAQPRKGVSQEKVSGAF